MKRRLSMLLEASSGGQLLWSSTTWFLAFEACNLLAGTSLMGRGSSEGVAAVNYVQRDSEAARLHDEEPVPGSNPAGLLRQLAGDIATDAGNLGQNPGIKQPYAVIGGAAPAAQLDSSQPHPGGIASPAGMKSPRSTFAAFRRKSLEAAVGLQFSEYNANQPLEHLHRIGKSTRPQLLALAEQLPGPQPDSARYSQGSSGQGLLANMAGEAAAVEEGEPGAAAFRTEEAVNATGGGAAYFSGRINSHENR